MKNIIFSDQEGVVVHGDVKRLSDHVMQITGTDQNLSGFQLVTDAGGVFGKYDNFTTLYREIEDGFQVSDDGSVYVEPEPKPIPEPVEPTLEEIREAKVAEMEASSDIFASMNYEVTLSDGSVESFPLAEKDKIDLMGLKAAADAGEDNIPWHTADDTQHCRFFSNADFLIISQTAMNIVMYHTTYKRDIVIYIRSLKNIEDVNAVTYGMNLPEEYQSDVLKALLATMSVGDADETHN